MMSSSSKSNEQKKPNLNILIEAMNRMEHMELLEEDVLAGEQPDQTMGQLLDQVSLGASFPNLDGMDKVIVAAETEWVKCACGSLVVGIQGEGNAASPVTYCWEFLGGTDTDRTQVGDTFFWEAVQKIAPSVTGPVWNDYARNHPWIQIEAQEEEDEDSVDDDESDYRPPQADFPDIVRSIFLLAVANRILEGGIVDPNDGESPAASSWRH